MDESISLFLHATKLAKDLELDIQNLATQHDVLSKLDEIIRVFVTVREKLNAYQIDPSIQDQCRQRTKSSMMELFQRQGRLPERKSSSSGGMDHVCGRGLAMEVVGSTDVQGIASSSLQGPRRRKDIAEKRTMRVADPRMGNTEMPPDDGYTWRKYGQKEILGSKYPRGYYRCTHQKFYQCPAKKQVQRLDDDPYIFEVTYRGDHTCHMSSTAPSIRPPPSELTQEMSARPLQLLEFSLGSGASSSGQGPPAVRYGKETEYPVADMADVMFNSGSSSSNSMEFIFSMEDKWDQRDRKN